MIIGLLLSFCTDDKKKEKKCVEITTIIHQYGTREAERKKIDYNKYK